MADPPPATQPSMEAAARPPPPTTMTTISTMARAANAPPPRTRPWMPPPAITHPDTRRPRIEQHFFNDACVHLRVGSAQETESFFMHRQILVASSKYFHRVYAKSTITSSYAPPPLVKLLPEKPALFKVYAHWLYSGTLTTKNATDRSTGNPTTAAQEDSEYILLANAYFMAERMEDDDFADSIMDAFLSKMRSRRTGTAGTVLDLPGTECINLVYEKTTMEHPLRRLIVHIYSRVNSSTNFKQMRGTVDVAFVADLAGRLLEDCPNDALGAIHARNCEFHRHGKGETCVVVGRSRKRKRTGE